LQFAHDISDLAGAANIAPWAVSKTLFLDIVDVLKSDPVNMADTAIPAKIEGISFGPDVVINGAVKHTLWPPTDTDSLSPLPASPGRRFRLQPESVLRLCVRRSRPAVLRSAGVPSSG